MRITTKNYFKAISEVGFENLPDVLKKSHSLIEDKTNNGSDGLYENDAEAKKVFDLTFDKLEEFIDRKEDLSGLDGNPIIERAKKDAAGYKDLPLDKLKMIYRLELDAELEDGLTPVIKIRKAALEKAIASKEGKSNGVSGSSKNKFAGISNEIKFIHMYLNFHDKVLYKNTIGLFIDDLQKAITEKKITKKSPVAKEIMEMQELTFLCVVVGWVYFRAPDLSTANRLVAGMFGSFGAALPEPLLSRLGPLKAVAENLGVTSYLGGGAMFVETWLWVAVAGLIAFLAPNTQEIMAHFGPALPEDGRLKSRPPTTLTWTPRPRTAIAIGALFAACMRALSRPTEFLYFQF